MREYKLLLWWEIKQNLYYMSTVVFSDRKKVHEYGNAFNRKLVLCCAVTLVLGVNAANILKNYYLYFSNIWLYVFTVILNFEYVNIAKEYVYLTRYGSFNSQ